MFGSLFSSFYNYFQTSSYVNRIFHENASYSRLIKEGNSLTVLLSVVDFYFYMYKHNNCRKMHRGYIAIFSEKLGYNI